jgi:carbonic anhydrase
MTKDVEPASGLRVTGPACIITGVMRRPNKVAGRGDEGMPLRKLTMGFLDFQRDTFAPKREFFQQLARKQRPKILMVACSDSRVDPAILAHADPGDIFMIRNVANLVPPYANDESKHGTSAALEFGVKALEVEHIIVFGHVGCGGIEALLTADPVLNREHAFIFNWLQIADEARRRTLIKCRHLSLTDQLRCLEEESVKTSLANLLTFPWIEERVQSGRLRLHGWHFDLNSGNVHIYVPDRNVFLPLTPELAEQLQPA